MKAVILHLSDLQFGRHNVEKPDTKKSLYPNQDYTSELKKLLKDIDIISEMGAKPNLIVVSGDIAEWSLEDEYKQAEDFLAGICDHLAISRRNVILTPGNHDINRKLCEAARLTSEAKKKPFLPPYYEKFEMYEQFFKRFYQDVHWEEDPYCFSSEKLYVTYPFPEYNVVFVGLNSCIDESDREPHRGMITHDQLCMATEELNEIDKQNMMRIAVFHHNFLRASIYDEENLSDADQLLPTFISGNYRLMLHGHRHITQQNSIGDGKNIINILATGSAGLDNETIPNNCRRYQVIEIGDNVLRVYKRLFDATAIAGHGSWKPDIEQAQTQIYEEINLSNVSGQPDLVGVEIDSPNEISVIEPEKQCLCKLLDGDFISSVFWKDHDQQIFVDIDGDGIKEKILIGCDYPNGTKLIVSLGKEHYNLGYEIKGLNRFGNLGSGYYCQVAITDVNNDGMPEILFAVGNGLTMHLNIWKFDRSMYKSTPRGERINPFKYIGHLEGSNSMRVISGGEIRAPFGSVGLYSTYKWNGVSFSTKNAQSFVSKIKILNSVLVNGSVVNPEAVLSNRFILGVLYQTLGKDYEKFLSSMVLLSTYSYSPEEKLYTILGGVPGLFTIMEGILQFTEDGCIYVAFLNERQIKYYTNDETKKTNIYMNNEMNKWINGKDFDTYICFSNVPKNQLKATNGNYERKNNRLNSASISIKLKENDEFDFKGHASWGAHVGQISGTAKLIHGNFALYQDSEGNKLKFIFFKNSINIYEQGTFGGVNVTFRGEYRKS